MKNLMKGYPAKVILAFTIPFMLGAILQQLYFIADSKIVSTHVSIDAFSAVGATSVIANTMISFVNGLTQGFSILVANAFGAQDFKKMRRYIAGAIKLTIVFAIFFTVFGLIFIEDMLKWLNTPKDIMPDAMAYIGIIIAGICFSTLYNLAANVLRAVGDSRTPLYALIIGGVLNVGLDLLFVIKFGWKIEGAAYATVIAQAVSGIICIVLVIPKLKDLLPAKDEWKLEKGQYPELISAGTAMALMTSIVNIGTIVLQGAINGLGKIIVAAHTAARRVFDIMTVVIYSFAVTMTTFASQNMGAGRLDRVKQGLRQTMYMVTGVTTVLVIFCYTLGKPLLEWIVNSDNTEIIDASYMYMKLCIVFFYVLGPLLVLRSTLQGLGSKSIPLISSVLEMVLKIVSAKVLVKHFEYVGVAFTEPVSWIFMLIILVVGYAKFWRDNKDVEIQSSNN